MIIVGIVMIIIGIVILLYLTEITPIGKAGMTDDEKINLLLAERENSDYRTLSGILIGVGFLLVLISFGARRKRKGGIEKIKKKTVAIKSKCSNNIKKGRARSHSA